jgi:uncharacterized protein YuzE
MDSLKIFYDRDNHILTIWFDDPQKEFIAEEIGEELLVMQDSEGKTIGIERMNFVLADQNLLDLQLQCL